MKVFVVGGGNIAHSIAAKLSRTMPVTVLTRRPAAWGSRLELHQNETVCESKFQVVATSENEAISDGDVVFVALPQFAMEITLDRIIASLKEGATVVFAPAPARIARYAEVLARRGVRTVGFQRVPYISRIIEYGKSVRISDEREIHKIVVSEPSMRAEWDERCRRLFGGKVEYLSSFLALAFSNSNPLLHPARLSVLLERTYYDRMPLFYEEWTDRSSELYIKADREMLDVMKRFPQIDLSVDYESVLDHYGVSSARELTNKIRSVLSFKGLAAPYKANGQGRFVPDFQSRYFTEDVPYGTMQIQRLARKVGVWTPVIDFMIERIGCVKGLS